MLRVHEISNWERRAVRASAELLLEGVLQAAWVVLQDPQQQRQRAKRPHRAAKASTDKEVKQGQEEREENRTGHPKRELMQQVSPLLFSHSYATAESRSTCQCWVTSYFMLHEPRDIWPKRPSFYNCLTQCTLKATLKTNLKGT